MADSRKSPRSEPREDSAESFPEALLRHVAARLTPHIFPGVRVTVGVSGGLDSVVLLDVLDRLRERLQYSLDALHVDHGLSANSREWAELCVQLCRARGIPLHIEAVQVRRERGTSLEAAARCARYEAFRRHAGDVLALAHHVDDQAETLLLQLLRGAGSRGAAAMPTGRVEARDANSPRDLRVVRPFLDVVPRSRLREHALATGLTWIEDESNSDASYDRNYLRHEILPRIETAFPGYRRALARSAMFFSEASELLDDLARIDAEATIEDDALDVAALANLSEPRARNLLRHFLRLHGLTMPSARRLKEAVRQLVHAGRDRQVDVVLGGLALRRYGGKALLAPVSTIDVADVQRWQGEDALALAGGAGELHFERATGTGISAVRLQAGRVEVRRRRGGERMRPDCRRPHRTLKNLLQEARVAPWVRSRIPLLFCDGDLVCVPGIGVDCNWQARAGEPGIALIWRSNAMQLGYSEVR